MKYLDWTVIVSVLLGGLELLRRMLKGRSHARVLTLLDCVFFLVQFVCIGFLAFVGAWLLIRGFWLSEWQMVLVGLGLLLIVIAAFGALLFRLKSWRKDWVKASERVDKLR